MTILARNAFAIFGEEGIDAVIPKADPESKVPKPETKKTSAKPTSTKLSVPAQTKTTKDGSSQEQKVISKGGRGGLPSVPRSGKSEPTSDSNFVASDHIKEESRLPRGNARPHREAPIHGRKFDRHSGTGRNDQEKKEVAGHSWGKPIDVPEGVSAEEALKITELEKTEPSTSKPTSPEEKPAAPAVETSQSFSDYLNQQKRKKASLNLTKPEPRKPNEGNFDDEQVPLKILNKSVIKDNDSLAGLLKGSPKSTTKKTKKEKEKKETIIIEPRFPLNRSQRPPRGGARVNYGGPRQQFNKRSPSPSS
ncbi:hypothetical protein HMI54_012582 [Coelomomyces lativittatus]|nr:hypothetical protein HMI56_001136 [Coelomomyces lativittatus]KAJ1509696.1 hypothetical protein HMI55_007292 [Coelomomyces lativittatus]KAJ1515288.1 hypothetical protein HMI54_012582 [Coelomomyces lativittatus]